MQCETALSFRDADPSLSAVLLPDDDAALHLSAAAAWNAVRDRDRAQVAAPLVTVLTQYV